MHDPLPEWPTFGLNDDARPALRLAAEGGRPLVLATLTMVDGGGPRAPGTQMVFADGVVSGYFSGGCVEADVAGHAMACLEDGEPRTLVYGAGSPWPDIRLLCGARIEIFLERISPGDECLAALLRAERDRRPVIWMSDGRTRLCAADPAPWPEARVRRLHEPVQRLVVVGGDPSALAIAALGAQSGMETTLVRPKGPMSPPPLEGVAYRREDAGAALAALSLDPWTAVAVATHDLETDAAALVVALPSAAGYVGLLGARRRLPERLVHLQTLGISDADLARLRAPIGLDIGGKAPWEVAISVIGEIMAERVARAKASGRP